MKSRTRLDRADLEDRFTFDLESGTIRYRRQVKGNKPGDIAGTVRSDGYVRLKIGGKPHFAHRLIYFIATGDEPGYLDHINGQKSDNRIANLRAATNSNNMANHGKKPRNCVFLRGSKWHGRVMKDYRTHRITPTPEREEAIKRLAELRRELHGEFAPC